MKPPNDGLVFLFSLFLFLFLLHCNELVSALWILSKGCATKTKAVIGEVSKSQFLDFRINLKPEMVVKVCSNGIKWAATSADKMGPQPDVTRDLEYLELEKKYKEIVASADELRLETMAYRDQIASRMINE